YSAALMGVAGALFAHKIGFLAPETCSLLLSIQVLLMVVVAGLGSLHGAFYGAVFAAPLPLPVSPPRASRPAVAAANGGPARHGAGKTTIFNVISRIYDPPLGRLIFDGEDITAVPPHEIARRGIARTFQNIELFEHASVLQNLLLGRHAHKRSGFVEEMLFLP